MDYSIVKALKKKLEGDIERSKCNINVYLNQSVGIGEHIDIVETVEKELTKLAEAEDKLETLINNFSTKDMKLLDLVRFFFCIFLLPPVDLRTFL